MEAAPGFEPGITVLQTVALTLGYAASSLPGHRISEKDARFGRDGILLKFLNKFG